MEFNNLNLDELLNSVPDSGKMFEKADVEVTVVKDSNEPVKDSLKQETNSIDISNSSNDEDREVTKEEAAAMNRDLAMGKLAEYESYENKIANLNIEMNSLNSELDELISKIKIDNKELIDKINAKSLELEQAKKMQEGIKEQLLPIQRLAFQANEKDKTLRYNQIQSTYVEPTEKNQFDLKKFREEQKDFWKENLEVMQPYAKITAVSDYIKITISKK